MKFITYAQNFEDVILWRVLKNIENGFYVDVGANHPTIDSVTKAFYDKGWNGINIEPEKELYDLLENERPNDINLNIAISADTDSIEFYVSKVRGWSTTNKNISNEQKKNHDFSEVRTLQAKTLDEILDKHNPTEVHFLKIDVEGAEEDVLKSFSFQEKRPWIIVIESTKPGTQIDVSSEWEHMITKHNYTLVYCDGLNKYYIAHEHKKLEELFKYPPNVFDNFILAAQVEAEAKANEAQHNYKFVANSKLCRVFTRLRLIKPLVKHLFTKMDKGIKSIVRSGILKKINQLQTNQSNQPQKLLIDCSFVYKTNINTGIQRVVNNIIKYADEYSKENGIKVLTVGLEDGFITEIDMNKKRIIISESPFLLIRFLNKVQQKLYWYIQSYRKPILVNNQDILLMLDSSWGLNIFESVESAKSSRAIVLGVLYDLIPISHPQFCADSLPRSFSEYLDRTTHYFDGYITISKTVMLDLQHYLGTKQVELSQYSFDYFHLGTDFMPKEYETGVVRDELQKVYTENQSVYLIVSTIEPRKNHQYVFDTFKELWQRNIDVALVIVGKIGWKTESLIQQMMEHEEYEKRLFVFTDLGDNELNYCYNKSKSLLFPSFVEGFGLPIIESLKNGLPVLASNTPIHKEVGGDAIEYFDIKDITSLVDEIQNIEEGKVLLKYPDGEKFVVNTWKMSAKELFDKVLLSNISSDTRETHEYSRN